MACAAHSTLATVGRSWTFLFGLVVMACTGTLYAFSVYSSDLGDELGYTGKEESLIVGLGDIGFYVSAVASGWLVDVYGVRSTALLSAILMTGGYICMAYTYSGNLENSSAGLMGFYFLLVGVGSSGAYIAALAPNVRNFGPQYRGFVVGMLVAMTGLSALIFSQLHQALFVCGPDDQDTFGFLLFMGIVLGSVSVLGAFTLVVVKPAATSVRLSDEVEDQRSLQPPESDTSTLGRLASAAGSIQAVNDPPPPAEAAPLLTEDASASAKQVRPVTTYTTWRVFKTRDFWLMFVILMFGSGAGLMYINSVGKIVEALATEADDVSYQQSLQVSLLSGMSCTGRLGFGLISDLALSRYGVRRRIFMSVATALMLIAMVTAAAASDLGGITAATAMVGLAYGGLFSTTPTIVSERYGVSGFGVNWGWLCWSTAIGGQIMTLVFGAVWDAYVLPGEACQAGATCYRLAVIINVATVAQSLVVAAVFSWRRKPTDDAGYVRRQQELEESWG